MSSRILLGLALASTIALGAAARAAAAQPTADDAAADALFDEAVALRNAGDRAGACAKFRRSYKLAAARGTLLNIAECFEAEGKLASAWATYRRLADQAEAAGDRDRLTIARAKRAELEPRLAYVTIAVAAAVDGIEVWRNESQLPGEVIGDPVPIDAGACTITVSAPGHHAWTAQLDVVDGSRHRVDAPALVPLPPPPPSPSPLVEPPPQQHLPRRRHARASAGLVMVGAGAVSATVGLGFGVAAWRAEDNRLLDAHAHADRANLFVGIGAAIAVTGAVLYWTAPDGAEVSVSPIGAPGMVGVAVGARR